MTPESIDSYVRHRATERGLSLSEVCRQANISRQTLLSLGRVPDKLPTLQTVVRLAHVLGVHPLRLLQLVFDHVPMAPVTRQRQRRGDQSAFVNETIPDGSLVFFGQKFTKTWQLQNLGHVAWENRYLQCMDEEIVVYSRLGEEMKIASALVPDLVRVAIPDTAPGETATINVMFTAPRAPCKCISYWKSVFADGSLCFPKSQGLSVHVKVSSLASAAAEGAAHAA